MAQPRGNQKATRAAGTILALALAIGLLVGCGGDEETTSPEAPGATPIARLESDALSLVRIEFCDLVPKAALRLALKGGATSARTWSNGDPVPGGAKADVGHEFGCAWTGAKRRTARAWVFARPVTPAFARSIVKDAKSKGCTPVKGPAFGNPSLTQICRQSGGIIRVRHAGLFEDTWLTCETSGADPTSASVRRRADAWCVSVAQVLDAG